MGKFRLEILTDNVDAVKALLNDTKYNFVAIGYHLRKIDDDKLYRETGHENIWEFAKDQFGLSKSSASRFMAINKRFSVDGYSDRLADDYQQFNVSQMSEMLTLTDEQIGQIDASTTIREIRDMKPKPEKKDDPVEEPMEGHMAFEDYPGVVPENEVVATSQQDEKSIPKRPDIRGFMDDPYCPNCDRALHYKKDWTCPGCNQTIDWDSVKVFFEFEEEKENQLKNGNLKTNELPVLKNNDQRGDFIDSFESWPLWIDCKETDEKIYRYDLGEGIAIAVREKLRHRWIPGKYKYSETETEYAGHEFYLIGVEGKYDNDGLKFRINSNRTFYESLVNRSMLIEFIKKYQKGEVQ